ncbi:IS200/IS605 family element transposase accessory protein TnpB [candidate division TA06 bacterium]|uniref:IS200/IS605 family element transposase accessory protein TnpB n=1 Tax=candidate division TA06 bacterium TaxID=2250710 RepID=A0A933I9Y0_UNCT6|nr:IS200/IS605 family element transposase accessory protein TnpB [candidate division TA06 bacterium]
MRIIRPYYGDEIEKFITAGKEKSKADGADGALTKIFWDRLKASHPEIVSAGEFYGLLCAMRMEAVVYYNRAISKLYQSLIVDVDGAQVSTAKALSAGPYHEFRERFTSYISLGLRQKLQSNFRRKELLRCQLALPTAKSDRFPIPISKQVDKQGKGGFKVSELQNGDFIIELPLMAYHKAKGKTEREYVELDAGPAILNIPVILSTQRRRANKTWFKDEGTDAEIRRVMSGEYKVSWLEILQRNRFGKAHGDWYVNFTIKYQPKDCGLDPKVKGGIDIGLSSPLVCAVTNSLDRLTIRDNDLVAFNKRALARRRTLLRRNRYKRAGHGSANKLEPITALTAKNELYRKAIMRRWAREAADFFRHNKAAAVNMEDLTGIKDREDYFSQMLRSYWNYSQMQTVLENKLKEYGIAVNYINPKDTSKTCHSCGHVNQHFDFSYRSANKFPMFKCVKCGVECGADYNAARNIAVA